MSCESCEWKNAAERALDVSASLPDWKTNRIEFFTDLANSIEEREHVTERQLEVIDDAESEAD